MFALLLVACGSRDPVVEAEPAPPEVIPELDVDVAQSEQTIAGFGASSAWTAPRLSASLAEKFFSAESGLGLSLLRIQIRPDGTSSELGTVDAAWDYGVRVWASPWSPPPELKTNDSTRGGALVPAQYSAWARTLAGFAASMAERGTPLIGISAQNEPDYDADWDSCVYTAAELTTFVTQHLVPALDELAPDVGIIAPESANWDSLREYAEPLLDAPAATDRMLAVAVHEYGGSPFALERAQALGQQLWMTETSDGNHDADPGMTSAIQVASQIHVGLTQAHVSAWHYWWLLPRIDNNAVDTNAALTDPKQVLTKRAYALGQFSRFIRPGFVRIGATQQLARQVSASAYQSPDQNSLVLVFVSSRYKPMAQIVNIPHYSAQSAELWLTDETHSLEKVEPTPKLHPTATGTKLTFDLAGNSITTLVLKAADAAPVEDGEAEEPAAPTTDAGTAEVRP
jgi:glucuronoarabinoxylan endo-1,4-beta-xylanase